MRASLIAALLVAGPALADKVARSGSAELRLMETQCSHGGTLAHLKPEWRAKFRNARLLNNGKIIHYGCWILTEEGDFYIQYEDGDHALLPTKLFAEEGA
jgi:hypothetical protein